MIDWTKSMQQTYEYYKVDPGTWKNNELLDKVLSSSIKRDVNDETLGSASFELTEDINECYVRTFLVATQNKLTERFPLGTHLCQSSQVTHDGKISKYPIDGYTPLIELKEKCPPLGYSIAKGVNILDVATRITRENVRAPVVNGKNTAVLTSDFVAETDDTWFTFLVDLLACAKYEFGLDELGRIIFVPIADFASLRPIWTYTDDNSPILQPEITIERDLFGIPNVVEVIYSNKESSSESNENYIYARAVNDDPNSPISTVNRGREIVNRITDPEVNGIPNQDQLNDYARQTLKNLSALERTLTYTHGYCPVQVGDCVLLNYTRAGLNNVRARVTSQSINCEAGCQVEETAVYTTNLWG